MNGATIIQKNIKQLYGNAFLNHNQIYLTITTSWLKFEKVKIKSNNNDCYPRLLHRYR